MTESDSVLLQYLRAIRQKLDQMDERLRDHTARFAAIEQRLGSIE